MLQKLYAWTMRLAEGPRALLALIAVSFAESSFFPIPPDTLLIPMVLAQRQRVDARVVVHGGVGAWRHRWLWNRGIAL